jgi:hypothetical protein
LWPRLRLTMKHLACPLAGATGYVAPAAESTAAGAGAPATSATANSLSSARTPW